MAHLRAAQLIVATFLVGSFSLGNPAWGCPYCQSKTGQRVYAGIFNEHFGTNVALIVLPWLFLALLVLAILYLPGSQRISSVHSKPDV